jgi:putative oxidoreductase
MAIPHIVLVAGRALLAALFILAGITKFIDPKPVRTHMAQEKVPTFLLPLVALVEIGAGSALLLGFYVPFAAGALSLFCLATAFMIHLHLSDRVERTQFVKDIALAGSLAAIAATAM